MRYKVSFEFETDDTVNGLAIDWAWVNLLSDVEDDHTKIDFDTLTVYKQEWKALSDDD